MIKQPESTPHDDLLPWALSAVAGIPLDQIADAVDRQGHHDVRTSHQLPIDGSPGYRHARQMELVELDGAPERLAILQQWLANPEIPRDIYGHVEHQVRALSEDIETARVWAAMGVEFGDPVDGLFRTARLPEGWELESTDHPMWSTLRDERGRARARMFYKAAFYDRKACIHLVPRFSVSRIHVEDRAVIRWAVFDCGIEAFSPPSVSLPHPGPHPHADDLAAYLDLLAEAETQMRRSCEDWLAAHWPCYNDPAAHW